MLVVLDFMFPVEYLAVLSCPLNLKQYCYYIQFNCPVGGGVISNNAVDLGRHCLVCFFNLDYHVCYGHLC